MCQSCQGTTIPYGEGEASSVIWQKWKARWSSSTFESKNECCVLRASPPVLSVWLQTVKLIVKKWKCASLAREIGFSALNLRCMPCLIKGATQMCTSEKECNKLDLTAAQYFWLVDHNDCSRWFAISSSHLYAIPVTVLFVGLPKKTAELRYLILLSRVTHWAPVEMLLYSFAKVKAIWLSPGF